MSTDPIAAFRTANAEGSEACGAVVAIGLAGRPSGDLSAGERAALTTADVVFAEGSTEPAIVALCPRSALVEPVAGEGDPSPARERTVARARRLAADGWRVVWLAAAGSSDVGNDFGGVDTADLAAAPAPHRLATALNGLAG